MIELLAPGGSYEGMKAAVNAGADAVYMGGARFGARAYADNPEETGLLQAMDYCHLHGRKLYLTVNTLLKEAELEQQLYEYLLPLYQHGLDAVLVQDFGVFRFLKRNFPELPLHASTQMTLSGVEGARLLKRMGAERIVVSRELSLAEISEIHEQVDVEIESFVHGALCYCYSGQCLMSSLIGGRSGNRGRCAQPCRLPYELYQKGQKVSRDSYLLSLKDICTLELLPQMIQAGICSYKIEGRMKRPEYAAGVTEIYRNYLDLCKGQEPREYRVDEKDMRTLMDLYNRGGFSKGYYQVYNDTDMMSMKRPNHYGTPAAEVIQGKGTDVTIKALEPLWTGDVLEVLQGKKEERPYKKGASDHQRKQELVLQENVAAGSKFILKGKNLRLPQRQILHRTRCEKLLHDLKERYLDQDIFEKIKGNFMLWPGKPAILEVVWKDWKIKVTGEVPQTAQKQPLQEATVYRQLNKTGGTPFCFETLNIQMADSLFYPLQSLNELRREALTQLEACCLQQYQRQEEKRTTVNVEDSVKAEDSAKAEDSVKAEDSAKAEDPAKLEDSVRTEEIKSGRVTMLEADLDKSKVCESKTWEQGVVLAASVQTFDQLAVVLQYPMISAIYLDSVLFMMQPEGKKEAALQDTVQRLHQLGIKCYLAMPYIWRKRSKLAFEKAFSREVLEQLDGFLLRSVEELEYLRDFEQQEMIADSGIYSYNREAAALLQEQGITRETLPLELNYRELQERGCGGSELQIYGRLPLMVTAQCLVKNTTGCRKTPQISYLKDRKAVEFPVQNQCPVCTNIIYNSLPLELLSCSRQIEKLSLAVLRLSFTTETETEMRIVLSAAQEIFERKQADAPVEINGTRGHFKRGVE